MQRRLCLRRRDGVLLGLRQRLLFECGSFVLHGLRRRILQCEHGSFVLHEMFVRQHLRYGRDVQQPVPYGNGVYHQRSLRFRQKVYIRSLRRSGHAVSRALCSEDVHRLRRQLHDNQPKIGVWNRSYRR